MLKSLLRSPRAAHIETGGWRPGPVLPSVSDAGKTIQDVADGGVVNAQGSRSVDLQFAVEQAVGQERDAHRGRRHAWRAATIPHPGYDAMGSAAWSALCRLQDGCERQVAIGPADRQQAGFGMAAKAVLTAPVLGSVMALQRRDKVKQSEKRWPSSHLSHAPLSRGRHSTVSESQTSGAPSGAAAGQEPVPALTDDATGVRQDSCSA
jgi:hypothetical protein